MTPLELIEHPKILSRKLKLLAQGKLGLTLEKRNSLFNIDKPQTGCYGFRWIDNYNNPIKIPNNM